jgi:outer membrane protein, heavy metal efflux system
MSRRAVLLGAILALGVVGATATGQQPPDPTATPAPPVEALVSRALERSPDLAALAESLAAAREMITPASALPDPMVELMLQDVGFPQWTVGSMEMSMVGPTVSQSFPWPGKRQARRDAAQSQAGSREVELASARRTLAASVRALYGKIYALDRERDILTDARELLTLMRGVATGRYAAAAGEQEPVLKAQVAMSRLEERVDDLTAARATLVAALNGLLDQPGETPLGEVEELPERQAPPMPWGELAAAASPEVAARTAAVVEAERRMEVTRLAFKPDIESGAGIGLRGGFDPVVTLRVGVALPLWRGERQAPELRAAEHELALARAALRSAQALARAEGARLATEEARSQAQLRRYREALLPQSAAAIDAARVAYLDGRMEFNFVVADIRDWLDVRVGLAQRETECFLVLAQAAALLGEDQVVLTGRPATGFMEHPLQLPNNLPITPLPPPQPPTRPAGTGGPR